MERGLIAASAISSTVPVPSERLRKSFSFPLATADVK
jgi:hypothetical protein